MPGPPCAICQRVDLADVERMAATQGNRAAAKHYSLAESSLRLHLKHKDPRPAPAAAHPEAPAPTKAPEQPAQSLQPVEPDLPLGDLEGRILQLHRAADRLRLAAENGPLRERGTALTAAMKAMAEAAALRAKLEQGREPELLTSKAWAALRGRLVEALRPFPDAAGAVAEALRELEAA